MSREYELKLELPREAAGAFRRHALFHGRESAIARQVTTYFDTSDRALRAAGLSLRVRESDGRYVQTVKQGGSDAAGLFDRAEWEMEVEGPFPDLAAAAGTPITTLLGKKRRKLKPVVVCDMKRTLWLLSLPGGTVEVTLDEGKVAAGKRSERLTELELELKDGSAVCLFSLAAELAATFPLHIGVLTKAERGFALADERGDRAVKAEPISLGSDMSAAAGFTAIAHACLRHFRINAPLVAGERDPLALHQARVAMRRFRSALSLFRPIVADAHYPQLREDLRWFTGQLGEARNIDVMLKRVDAKPLRKVLKEARSGAYAQAVDALESQRLRVLMIELVGWIEAGGWRQSEGAAEPLRQFAAGRLAKRWDKVRKGGSDLAALDEEQLHRLRIEGKKLRYAIEFLASLHPGDDARTRQQEALEALEALQDGLGEINDRHTAKELLDRLLASHPRRDSLMEHAGRAMVPVRAGPEEIRDAQQAYERLMRAGKFWRSQSAA